MDTSQIRQLFLNYFHSKGHAIIPSSSLVPSDDPSLLFTNAGMVQFKKAFLGQEVLPYQQATSCQRCLRAGGKHNDLENVGFTSRHHTFFEMLGNFSFGNYFKREAIFYAWEFITKYLKIPATRLWITVYEEDLEAADIWLNEIKIDPTRFSKCDANENFWSMGDVGPCGPCTEIYYDHGVEFIGSPPGSGDPADRYVEIYNLVFMQYNRDSDGKLKPLPRPCVDTGMGLERVAAIMQGVHNNYDIDLFAKLIKDLSVLMKIKDLSHSSLKVIADPLRACSFLILDGVFPSNEGRGYVLRRIMRRAIRHGYKLGKKEPFLHLAVDSLVRIMGQDFEFLKDQQHKIAEVLLNEELQFAKTLENGMKLLSQAMAAVQNSDNKLISGEILFKLYDTYGFPVDLTQDILREHNLQMDLDGFNQCMSVQQNRARNLMKFKDLNMGGEHFKATNFLGYEKNSLSTSVLQIFSGKDQQLRSELSEGEEGKIVLTDTPFYAQAGGQVGDLGILYNQYGKFIVTDTQKVGNTNLHIGKMESGSLRLGATVEAKIDVARRNKIRSNHSATHLLHAALRAILGEHVKQKGSLVDATRLRFDFEHAKPVTKEQILLIELAINAKIRDNHEVVTEIMPLQAALAKGAMALFDEKYQEKVRVLNIAEGFSIELCGGTHVNRLGELGGFKIVSEEAVAAGVRRIEAITGEELVKYSYFNQDLIDKVIKLCKIPNKDSVELYLNKLLQKNKDLEKNLENLSKKNVCWQIENLKNKVVTIGELSVLVAVIDDVNPIYLKFALDILKQHLNKAIVILGCKFQDKSMIAVSLTKNILTEQGNNVSNFSAVHLIQKMAPIINGKGGGRVDFAEASGGSANLSAALDVGYNEIKKIFNH